MPLVCVFCRANFVGTSFTVYDNGLNPGRGVATPSGSNLREELAIVNYVSTYTPHPLLAAAQHVLIHYLIHTCKLTVKGAHLKSRSQEYV